MLPGNSQALSRVLTSLLLLLLLLLSLALASELPEDSLPG